MSMLAGFFPPMENLIPLTVVGTQSLPASTGPAGVLKYGETPFSLKLMPNPGPNLILPLISAIVLLGLIGRAVLLDPALSRCQSMASRLASQFFPQLLRGLPLLPFWTVFIFT